MRLSLKILPKVVLKTVPILAWKGSHTQPYLPQFSPGCSQSSTNSGMERSTHSALSPTILPRLFSKQYQFWHGKVHTLSPISHNSPQVVLKAVPILAWKGPHTQPYLPQFSQGCSQNGTNSGLERSTHSALSFKILPKVVLKTVPILAWKGPHTLPCPPKMSPVCPKTVPILALLNTAPDLGWRN